MKFTIVSSSTRIGRVSHRIALALEKEFKIAGHEAKVIDLAKLKLPRFSERYSHIKEKPESWIRTMETLNEANGIIFLTPEYNGSLSSGLKNFIDVFAIEGFEGKPIGAATGSAGMMGGIKTAYQLQQVILSVSAYPQSQVLAIGEMQKKINEIGEVVDTDLKIHFKDYVTKFIDFSLKFSS